MNISASGAVIVFGETTKETIVVGIFTAIGLLDP